MPNCCPPCVEEMYGSGINPTTLTSGSLLVGYRDDTDPPCSLASTVNVSYSDVYVLPNSSDYILYRRKWNYVKNLYNPGYTIDTSGDWPFPARTEYFNGGPCSPSQTPDMAYWLDYNKFQAQFYEDLFNWTDYAQSRGTAAAILERWLQWKYKNGTTAYGNLPEHKRNDHKGHCWMLCPYDSNNHIERTRALLDLGDDEYPIEGRNDHGSYYMRTAVRGVWGFECTSDSCPYLTAYGIKYFYS